MPDEITQENAIIAGPGWTYTRPGYAIAQSLRQLRNHKLATISTLLVLGVALALPVMLFFAYASLQMVAGKSLDQESLTVFLDPQIDDLAGANLAEQWQARAGVQSTRFISSDEALQLLASNSELDEAIRALGSNPLPGAIVVYPDFDAYSADRMQELAESFRNIEEVDRVQMDLQWIHRLQAVVALIKWIGGLLAAFLTMTALLVIANTIRLELSRRKAELAVARLLGAGSSFVNLPIILTGALYGLIGGIIACIIALAGLYAVQSAVANLSSLYNSTYSVIMPTASQILVVPGISLLLGLTGAISSLYRSSHELTYSANNL